jgi:hypothetical protein
MATLMDGRAQMNARFICIQNPNDTTKVHS